jgi:hypothetical protein
MLETDEQDGQVQGRLDIDIHVFAGDIVIVADEGRIHGNEPRLVSFWLGVEKELATGIHCVLAPLPLTRASKTSFVFCNMIHTALFVKMECGCQQSLGPFVSVSSTASRA